MKNSELLRDWNVLASFGNVLLDTNKDNEYLVTCDIVFLSQLTQM